MDLGIFKEGVKFFDDTDNHDKVIIIEMRSMYDIFNLVPAV